jgi:hypothetical protein
MSTRCQHARDATDVSPPRDVCEACTEIGGTWVHLRQCLTCGRTLCCDDSPNQHMTGHYREIGHQVMRGADPGDAWTWCFVDGAMIRETPDGWETYDPFVEDGLLVARQHLEAGRTSDPAQDYVTAQGFPLGEWFAYVRAARSEDSLDGADGDRIERLPGWHW